MWFGICTSSTVSYIITVTVLVLMEKHQTRRKVLPLSNTCIQSPYDGKKKLKQSASNSKVKKGKLRVEEENFAPQINDCIANGLEEINPVVFAITYTDDEEPDGALYTKIRDPPGQKCIYILPGDTEKETYRMSTFLKFPSESPVNPCLLAKYGFYYTGYKDRVKCFSCGSSVHDWKEDDLVNHRRWHLYGCLLALGKDKTNKPVGSRPLKFVGDFVTEVKSLDSGYESASSSNSETNAKVGQHVATQLSTSSDQATSSESKSLLEGMSEMSIGNKQNEQTNNSIPITTNQTARVVSSIKTAPPRIEGLVFASITSEYHEELLTKTLNLFKEEDRRKSFFGWAFSYPYVTPKTLAASGFFYLGNSDRVQCFSCTGVLRNWNENDNVEQQHASHFPHCKMVLQIESRNIPLPETLIRLQNARKKIEEPADPSRQEIENLKRQFPCLNPVNPHMKDFNARLQTFDQRWPSQKVNATPQHIAKAGFYFLGERDRAKCWYCNGGLQNWEPNDEPFTEHAKWFPGCEYIIQCKGLEFVKQIVSKFPNLRRPALRNPRFDHKTLKLIPAEPHRDQQQPLLVDPQANNSAGEVLRRYSPSSSREESEAQLSELERAALEMGFELSIIKKIIQKQIQKNGRNFSNVEELVEALILEPRASPEIAPDPNPVHQINHEVGGNAQVLVGDVPQSLKRNNDGSQTQTQDLTNERRDGETPFKKTKIGKNNISELNDELLGLEKQRNCKLCLKIKADNVIMPCGHLSLCNNCASNAKFCPLCRGKIQKLIKAYIV